MVSSGFPLPLVSVRWILGSPFSNSIHWSLRPSLSRSRSSRSGRPSASYVIQVSNLPSKSLSFSALAGLPFL